MKHFKIFSLNNNEQQNILGGNGENPPGIANAISVLTSIGNTQGLEALEGVASNGSNDLSLGIKEDPAGTAGVIEDLLINVKPDEGKDPLKP